MPIPITAPPRPGDRGKSLAPFPPRHLYGAGKICVGRGGLGRVGAKLSSLILIHLKYKAFFFLMPQTLVRWTSHMEYCTVPTSNTLLYVGACI